MRQILTMALTLLMAVAMQGQTYWNGTSNKTFSGSGTQTDPYLIGTPEQLAGLAERTNVDKEDFAGKFIQLTADIYLTNFNDPDTANWKEWHPIAHEWWTSGVGVDTAYFRGHFDGNGHTVYNLYYGGGAGWGDGWDPTDPLFDISEFLGDLDMTAFNRGLFARLDGGTIENLNLSNAHMCGISNTAFLVVKAAGNSVIRNCHVQGEFRGMDMYPGGLVSNNSGLVENCSSTVNMSGAGGGAIVYTNETEGVIKNCVANGVITATASHSGGFANENKGLIEKSVSTVNVSALYGKQSNGKTLGHIAGGFCYRNGGLIRECAASGSVTSNMDFVTDAHYPIAGFCAFNGGKIESSYCTGDLIDISESGWEPLTASFVGINANGGLQATILNCFSTSHYIYNTSNVQTKASGFLNWYTYNTITGEGEAPLAVSRQAFCWYNKDELSSTAKSSALWAGYGVNYAFMHTQAFVDTLNLCASFLGTSQWELRNGIPQPTGVIVKNVEAFLAGGEGTKENPYLISNKTQLENFRWLVNHGYDFCGEYIKQTADIALNAPMGQWEYTMPEEWQTIGIERKDPHFDRSCIERFRGIYDGDYHEIQNMYVDNLQENQGLFGFIGMSGMNGTTNKVGVRNLGVTDAYMVAKRYSGILAGSINSSNVFLQCWTSGQITAADANGTNMGALVGYGGASGCYFLNCSSSVQIIGASGEVNGYKGSVWGDLPHGWMHVDTMINYLFTGNINNGSSGTYGRAYYTENAFEDGAAANITNDAHDPNGVRSTAYLQSKEYVNLLNYSVSRWNASHDEELQMDYWEWQDGAYPKRTQTLSYTPVVVTFESNGGNAIQSESVVPSSRIGMPIRPQKENQLFAGWYKDAGLTQIFDFYRDSIQNDMTLYARWINDDRFEVDITPFNNKFTNTYHIKTAAQLRGFAQLQNGIYDWSSGTAVLTTAPRDFTGKTIVLDNDIILCDTTDWQYWGRGAYGVPWKAIGSRTKDESESSVCFRGTFDGQGHVIYGLYVETGGIPGYENSGLFCWTSAAAVRNVGIEASVIDAQLHNVIGQTAGQPTYCGSDRLEYLGLLIGHMSSTPVSQCYAAGHIYTTQNSDFASGFIGSANDSIINSFARIDVYKDNHIQREALELTGKFADGGKLRNCYNAGRNKNSGISGTTSYFNKELIANPASNTSAKSTYEMHTMNAYANWDFDNIWARNDTVNDGYPVLRIFHPNIENSPDPVTVTGITLQPTSATVISGESIQLNASVLPADAGNQKINWTVSNATYGEVDENGLVQTYYITSKAGGTQSLIVTATTDDGGYVKRCTLNIQYPTVSLKLLKSRRIGETEWGSTQATSITNFYWVYGREYLVATYTTPVVTHTPFTWTSSDETLMTVESLVDDTTYMDGNNERRGSMAVFRCLATGSATLTATSEKGYIGKHTRTIKKYPATSITVAPTSASLYVGETQQLTATMTPSYATTEVEWTADDPNVVLVSETGLVTAVGAGTTAVTATAGNYSATCTFTVESNTFYTIFFLDDDAETELWSTQVREGETPVYAGPTPTKDSTDAVVYTFNGWTPELAPATEDAFYIATYSESVRQYTIRFLNWDDEELQSSLVDFGELPVYTGETPAKPSDNEYMYVFNGWSPEIIAVSGNADYTAQFSATLKPQPACDPVVCDFTKKANGHSNYNDKWTYDDNWEIFGGANNNNGWEYVKMGGKSATLSSANPVYIVNKSAFDCEIASVKVTFPAGSFSKSGMSCNSWGVKVYSDLACTQLLYTVNGGTISNSAAELTIEAQENEPWSAGCAIQVYWDLANTSSTNGIVLVSKIEYIPAQSTLPTDIQNVSDSANNVARKVLINGQIFILRGDQTYTLQGQEVR